MNEYEFESLAMLLDYLESAGIIAGAMFERHCKDKNYDRALVFSGLRDRLHTEVEIVKDYMKIRGE